MAIITRDVPIRVRYNETDQMGIVHHSNYIFYFEIGRTELMRSLGTSYKEMEERGALLVVRDVQLHYIAPAYYDEIITVRVSIPELPTVKVTFDIEIFNEAGDLIHKGYVVLACVDKETRRPKRCPQWFVDTLVEGGRRDDENSDRKIPVQ